MSLTIREEIKRRFRWAQIPMIGGMVGMLALRAYMRGMPAHLERTQASVLLAAGAISVIAVIAGCVVLAFFVKCPKCGRNISAVASGIAKKPGKRVNFCPHCGANLDGAAPSRVIS